MGRQARAAHEYLATLLHGSSVREVLDTATGVCWDVAITLDTETVPDTGFLVTAEEIQQLYTRAILSTAAQCPQPDTWPGTLPRTLDTLLTMVTAATSASRQQLQASVGRAYIQAWARVRFHDSLLTGHLAALVAGPATESSAQVKYFCAPQIFFRMAKYFQCLRDFGQTCLGLLERRLQEAEAGSTRLGALVTNLGVLVSQDQLGAQQLEDAVRRSLEHSFRSLVRGKEAEIREKLGLETGRVRPMELCRDVINAVTVELHTSVQDYENLFRGSVQFGDLKTEIYVNSTIELLRKSLPPKIKLPYLTFSEEDPRVVGLMLAWESFIGMKRLWRAAHPFSEYPAWLFEVFSAYPEVWIQHLAVNKAEFHLDNMLHYVRQHNGQKPGPAQPSSAQTEETFSRCSSQEDIVLLTLTAFMDLSKGCWRYRENLEWPDHMVRLKTGLVLVKEWGAFEKRLLNQFERIHLEDNEYDATELCDFIKLVEGLLSNHLDSNKEIAALHQEIANDDDIYSLEELETLKDKLRDSQKLIENIKTGFEKEIDYKLKGYCEGRREKIKQFIKEKKLTCSEADDSEESLMKFIDEECRKIYEKELKHQAKVIISLWDVVEQELLRKFEEKKAKNKYKSKPLRFAHYKTSIPEMRDAKKIIFNNFDILEVNVDTYQKSRFLHINTIFHFLFHFFAVMKDVAILTENSQILINRTLRLKAEKTVVDLDDGNNNNICPKLCLKLAYLGATDELVLELLSLAKVS